MRVGPTSKNSLLTAIRRNTSGLGPGGDIVGSMGLGGGKVHPGEDAGGVGGDSAAGGASASTGGHGDDGPGDGPVEAGATPSLSLIGSTLGEESAQVLKKNIKNRRETRVASMIATSNASKAEVWGGMNLHAKEDLEELLKAVENGNAFLAFGILNPHSSVKLGWDLFVIMLLIYTALSVPYTLAFDTMYCQTGDVNEDSAVIIIWIVDSLFWLDMLLTFNTAVEDPFMPNPSTWDLCTNRIIIGKSYVKSSYFWLDLAGNIPIQAIETSVNSSGCSLSVLKALRLNRLMRLLRLMKLIRLTKIEKLGKALHRIKDSLSIHPNHIRLVKLLLSIFIITHLMACFIYILTEWEAEYYSFRWATQIEIVSIQEGLLIIRCPDILYDETVDPPVILNTSLSRVVDDPFSPGRLRIECKRSPANDDGTWVLEAQASHKYLISLYTIFTTLTSIGYGDIVMVTAPEYGVGIVVILVGASTFAVVVGNMAALLGKRDMRAMQFKEQMEDLDEFMHQENLPLDLRVRTRTFFEYGYTNTREIPSQIQELSSTLKADVAMYLHHDLVTTVPFFKDCGKDFLTAIVLRLKAQTLSPGDYLYEAGEFGDSMYFLTKGSLEMVIHEKLGLLAELKEGAYVGESCVLGLSETRQVSIRATTWCNLFRLSMGALEDCISRFPDAQQHFLLLAKSQSAEKAMHKALQNVHGEANANSPESSTGKVKEMWGECEEPPVVTRALARSKAGASQGVERGSWTTGEAGASPLRRGGDSSLLGNLSPMARQGSELRLRRGHPTVECNDDGADRAAMESGSDVMKKIESARAIAEASKAALSQRLAKALKQA